MTSIFSDNVYSGSDVTRPVFRKGITRAAERQFLMRELVGTSDSSIFKLQEELTQNAGDTFRMRFSPTRDQKGYRASDTNKVESAARVDFTTDQMTINNHGMALRIGTVMDQQRTDIPLKNETLGKYPTLWARYFERNIIFQTLGFTPANTEAGLIAAGYKDLDPKGTEYHMSGMNVVTAVDANHRYFANGNTTVAGVAADSAAGFKLQWIDDLELQASDESYMDYPILPGPDGLWVVLISLQAARQLKKNSSANEWNDLQRARLEGGEKWQSNPKFTSVIGRYSRSVIVASNFVPRAVNDSDPALTVNNTRLFALLGANSGVLAYGRGYGGSDHIDYREAVDDQTIWWSYTDSTFGFKRSTFENLSGTKETYGCIVGCHYTERS